MREMKASHPLGECSGPPKLRKLPDREHEKMISANLISSVSNARLYTKLATVLASAGTPQFVADMKNALSVVVSLECVQFALEREGAAPRLLYDEGIPDKTHAGLIRRYFDFGYTLDPMCLAVQRGISQGFYCMSEVAPDNFTKSEYYRRFYLANGVPEDCYFVVDMDRSTKLTLCFFQGRSGSRFTTGELDFLRSIEPLVREMITLHAQRSGIGVEPNSDEQPHDGVREHVGDHIRKALDNFGSDVLTPREQQMATLILRGHSAKSASNVLRVSVETVRMHRRHLYAKLNINAQSELFAHFINWVAADGALSRPMHFERKEKSSE